MNKFLIVQSIGSSPADRFLPYMELQQPIHEEYAARCGADYECFRGYLDDEGEEVGPDGNFLNPTWNRLPLMLHGFDAGYEKVFWMDADTLAVDLDRNVFTETPDAPLLMTRVAGAHVEMPWKETIDAGLRERGLCGAYRVHPAESDDRCILPARHDGHPHSAGIGPPWSVPQWDVYNDGVLMAKNCPEGRAALECAWDHRRSPFESWHVPGMPELDWILDWVYDHPDHVVELHERWNWHYVERCPREEAVIMAWHGEIAQNRWRGFKDAYDEHYG